MNADLAAQILFWLTVAFIISGICYLFHRLTAPAAKRINDRIELRHYEWMAARGRDIPLPRTWLSGGLLGHQWNTDLAYSSMAKKAWPSILAAFALVVWLCSDTTNTVEVFGGALFGLVVSGGVLFGVRLYEHRRVHRALKGAGDLAPRTSFKVVANAHGLFVPVGDRVVDGARSDWSVNDVDIYVNKYGQGFCYSIALAHRDNPDQKIPLIASTFQDGDALMQVIAARVTRRP